MPPMDGAAALEKQPLHWAGTLTWRLGLFFGVNQLAVGGLVGGDHLIG